jgi:hypothetical protein
MMLTLRRLVGPARFDPAFKAYTTRVAVPPPDRRRPREHPAPRARRAPRSSSTRASATSPCTSTSRDYFEQALHTVDAVDFGLDTVLNRRRAGDAGYHRDEHGVLQLADREPEPRDTHIRDLPDEDVEAVVVVVRRGEFKVPVEIDLEFSDDTHERITWDGQDRYRLLAYPGRRVRAARLDPDRKLLLEVRRLDNVRAAPDAARPDGVSHAVGGLGESLALVTLGGLGL